MKILSVDYKQRIMYISMCGIRVCFLNMQKWMNLKECTQKCAYQVSSSNKDTLRATLHKHREFPPISEKLLSFTTSGLCAWGRGELSCFELYAVASNVNTS